MSGQLTRVGANRAVTAGVGQAVAASEAMYAALATALPDTPDLATLAQFAAHEITPTGYQRQPVTWTAAGTADPSLIANSAHIEFGIFTTDPPSVQHVFLCDTSIGTTGSVLAYWVAEEARDPVPGDLIRISAGDLTMSVD